MRTNRKGIVIGSGLTRLNPLIYSGKRNIRVVFAKGHLNKLNSMLDISKLDIIAQGSQQDLIIAHANKIFSIRHSGIIDMTIAANIPQERYFWAIVDLKEDGNTAELIIGENMEAGQAAQQLFVSFPDNRYKEQYNI